MAQDGAAQGSIAVGQALGTLRTAATSSQPCEGQRLLAPPDWMYSKRLSPGTLVVVAGAIGGSSKPQPDPGVLAELWPAPELAAGTAAASPALHEMLGFLGAGSELTVALIACDEAAPLLEAKAIALRVWHDAAAGPLVRPAPGQAAAAASALSSAPPAKASPSRPAARSPSMRRGSPSPAAQQAQPGAAEQRAAPAVGQLQREAVLRYLSDLAEDGSGGVANLLSTLALRHLEGRLLLPGNMVALPLLGTRLALQVVRAEPLGSAIVSSSTAVTIVRPGEQAEADGNDGQGSSEEDYAQAACLAAADILDAAADSAGPAAAYRAAVAGQSSLGISYDALGGFAQQLQALHDLVIMPLSTPGVLSKFGIMPAVGILLHGPPGTGKTVFARATARHAGAKLFVLNGPDVVSEHYGDSEAAIKGIFAAAVALQPSVVFIDELDALAPSRGGQSGSGSRASGGMSSRLVTTLLGEMDSLSGAAVVVVATTNRVDSIDPALRRPGRFDREVRFGVPSPPDRLAILQKHLAGMRHTLSDSQVSDLATAAHGFVGADLAALCNEAAMTALRRAVRSGSGASPSDIAVGWADLAAAKTVVRPSALREVAVEVPQVSWNDVGGLDSVKQRLKEAVEWPFKHRDALERVGAAPVQGILLYGPPGCSKTLLARAVASESRLNFIAVKGPELFSKYVGETERALAAVFSKARETSPAVVFIDELDGLATSNRDNSDATGVAERVLSQLLQELDGLQTRDGVIVLAATNRLDCLDPALLQPGRFDNVLHVPPPDLDGRCQIYRIHSRSTPAHADVDFDELAAASEGFTGAEIMAVCREAALAALVEDMAIAAVGMRHYSQAVAAIRAAKEP